MTFCENCELHFDTPRVEHRWICRRSGRALVRVAGQGPWPVDWNVPIVAVPGGCAGYVCLCTKCFCMAKAALREGRTPLLLVTGDSELVVEHGMEEGAVQMPTWMWTVRWYRV